MAQIASQIFAVVQLELKKTFFARRSLWIYLLAVGPALLYLIHAIDVTHDHEHRQALAAANPVSAEALRSIPIGATTEEVTEKLGKPYSDIRPGFRRRGRAAQLQIFNYTDGENDYTLIFDEDSLVRVNEQDRCNIQKDSAIFATVFQFFYLRLAVFFGCVGIFMNLFRGEMLDKSLHFYLLSPMRREVLMAGKFLAGLIAAVVIFTTGTALQLAALSWHFEPGAVSEYLRGPGWGQIWAYLGVTALACVGYGSVFLAAGLRFGNPILPGAAVLLWEAANPFLPAALKKVSIIFYLQSLCPVVASTPGDLSVFLRLLLSGAEPPPTWVAISGVLFVSGVILSLAALRARKLEINYGTE